MPDVAKWQRRRTFSTSRSREAADTALSAAVTAKPSPEQKAVQKVPDVAKWQRRRTFSTSRSRETADGALSTAVTAASAEANTQY